MANKPQDIVLFKNELQKLMVKHGCYLQGNFRIKLASDPNIDFSTYKCELADAVNCGNGVFDRMGPFICASVEEKKFDTQFKSQKTNITLMDVDKLLANGVKSPINRQAFHNRREWKEHLKANGCVEIGNDFNNAKETPGKLRGDFDVRDDLGKATYQVMEKYGQ